MWAKKNVSRFVNDLRKLPALPTHCENSSWWNTFQIHQKINNRNAFIGIGIFPQKPTIVYQSPLIEAQRYQNLLKEPHINSQTDIAKELGITRARVCQIMGLLKLAPEIQKELLALQDQQEIKYFTERRLRPLLQIKDQQQIEQFYKLKFYYSKEKDSVTIIDNL